MRTRVVLVVGLVALVVVLAAVLAQSAPRRSGTNGIPAEAFVSVLSAGQTACQAGELVPGDTAAVRLTIGDYGAPAPRVSVSATGPAGPLTAGSLAPGWRQGVVAIPVRRVAHTTPNVRVCLRNDGPVKVALGGVAPYAPLVTVTGAGPPHSVAAGLRFDYMRPGSESWWQLLPTLWHRMTLAKGDVVRHWAPWGALALMLLAAGLAVAVLGRSDHRTWRRLPAAAWLCALVALANGVAWSLIVPAFEVPDENAHYAYVDELAERGKLPHSIPTEGRLSLAEDAMLAASGYYRVVGIREDPSPFTEVQQHQIDLVARRNLSAKGTGDALGATNAPPLYFAIQTIPFKLAPGGTVLNRLALMRLVSAILGALTVLFTFLLIRELLPGTPWAWKAGALAAAFEPLFGFMSAGVNYDVMLYACATALLLAIARAFRRGLTGRAGVEIGLALGVGLVTKVAMDGLIPATALALLLLIVRARRARPQAIRAAAAAVAIAAVPVAAYLLWNHFSPGRSGLTAPISAASGRPGFSYNLREELSRIWQLFLPHLWLRPQFTYLPLWQTWFRGVFGVFGWLDYAFSDRFLRVVLAVVLGVCALALAGLGRSWDGLRRHPGELAVFVVAVAGVCAEIGVESYRIFIQSGAQFEQARYVLPLLGLYGLIFALAARAAGQRWGPAIGAALVILALGHTVLAQMLTVERYYS